LGLASESIQLTLEPELTGVDIFTGFVGVSLEDRSEAELISTGAGLKPGSIENGPLLRSESEGAIQVLG
jgi:hypothetical protein